MTKRFLSAVLRALLLSACQTATDPSTLSDDQLTCTTAQFIAHPGDEDDPFLRGNEGRRFVIDLSTDGVIDLFVPDAGNWPSDFQFRITGSPGGVLTARHQGFNRFTGETNPDLAYELRLSPISTPGFRTGELRSISTFGGTARTNRWLLSCENSGSPL
ncbi:hypothetical protein [Gymnodinialimonas hymeniacidonis]|uniref:hypothetical protein n=1 Tax=Gymnodinialimonas hymeniacidonis TaxID=3126508 RepID=UPI0034C5DAB2